MNPHHVLLDPEQESVALPGARCIPPSILDYVIGGPVHSRLSESEYLDQIKVWAHRYCHALTLALHQRTGWPIRALIDSRIGSGPVRDGGCLVHSGIETPCGDLLDARGLVPREHWGRYARDAYDVSYADWQHCSYRVLSQKNLPGLDRLLPIAEERLVDGFLRPLLPWIPPRTGQTHTSNTRLSRERLDAHDLLDQLLQRGHIAWERERSWREEIGGAVDRAWLQLLMQRLHSERPAPVVGSDGGTAAQGNWRADSLPRHS